MSSVPKSPERHPAEVLITVHDDDPVGQVPRRLFGSFVEHVGRGVYGGIFDPGHPRSDDRGFRLDVLELVRELGVTTVRYPGGNFVSGYDWRDGVGPVGARPTRLDLAWHTIEPNTFGTDEFADWCRAADVEPMLALNLGLGDLVSALRLVEYVNFPSGTTLSEQRAANGHPEPHDVRIWCLGNEMDGHWQLGHLSASEYGDRAARAAAALRMFDDTLELVVAGSANADMATFATWDREVLERTIDLVDLLSCHLYVYNDGDLPAFLASSQRMDAFIEQIAATVAHVRAATRSSRDVRISFDEWNVWNYRAHDAVAHGLGWERAPRLLEDAYTLADAVVVGTMLLSLLDHCDVVASACMAQLVNVIGPIRTETDHAAWRQTSFFPFADVARTVGHTVLRARARGATVPGPRGDQPAVRAGVTVDPTGGVGRVFLAHLGTTRPAAVTVDLAGLGVVAVRAASVLHHPDPLAANTATDPDAVRPQPLDARLVGKDLVVDLPPVSWASVEVELRKEPRG